jgi:polysaccharide biosynthesis transport protein
MIRQSLYTQRSQRNLVPSDPFEPNEGEAGGRPPEIGRILENVSRRWRLILTCVGVGATLALIAGLVLLPRYTAKALLIDTESESDITRRADEGAIDTHIAMLTSQAHLEHVLAAMEQDPQLKGRYARVSDLERHLKVMQELRSHLVAINFTAKSPQVAAGVANEIARLYIEESVSLPNGRTDEAAKRRIGELEENYLQALDNERLLASQPDVSESARRDAARRVADVQSEIDAEKLRQSLAQRQDENRKQALALSPPIRIYALARPPELPSSTRPIWLVIPAIIASALFGVALAHVLGRFDRRIQTPGDLRRIFAIPIAGAIPPKSLYQIDIRAAKRSASGYDAAIQSLAVNIFLNPKARLKWTVMVTCADVCNGDTLALDLALSAARMKSVLFAVVGDRAAMAHYSDAAEAALRDGARIDFLSLASDGPQLLAQAASGTLSRTLTEFRRTYDWIVLAAPPASSSPVAQVLAGMANAIVVTVAAGATTVEDVAATLKELSPMGEFESDAGLRRRLVFAMTEAGSPTGAARLPSKGEAPTAAKAPSNDRMRLARAMITLPESPTWLRPLEKPAPAKKPEAKSTVGGMNGAEKNHVAIEGAAK